MISDGKKIAQDERTPGTKRAACMGEHPWKAVQPGRDMKTSKRRETRLPTDAQPGWWGAPSRGRGSSPRRISLSALIMPTVT